MDDKALNSWNTASETELTGKTSGYDGMSAMINPDIASDAAEQESVEDSLSRLDNDYPTQSFASANDAVHHFASLGESTKAKG